MPIIDRRIKPTGYETYAVIDRAALTGEQRRRSRQKRVTMQECAIALASPSDTRLQAGDLLPAPEAWLALELALDALLLVRARSLQETAFGVDQIGDRQLPLEIGEQGLKTLYEPLSELCPGQQGIPVEGTPLPFTPASATSGHWHT